ncbi:DUF3857 and transglutaminase domain-containing protein [Hymenobacter sp. RP-2-7]|uniref:DUF3857 and transglutaminase domain-containing protein n=1 Tax=Hymenobacter polaris TaxID=2682546 RepID=A0A7Y0AG27_9BACT|nr:DUF3857 domain-containing protein [Hymenobacter polaris]NML66686.1 DUF3857 and transglutaminase domain-containing protein [Hymenobacter polaris]
MNKLLRSYGLATTGCLALAAARPAAAQQAPVQPVVIKFGQPAPADFEARNFVADSAAAAVVLSDVGTTRFRVDGLSFKMDTERTTRIKILKKAGYDYATVEIPLYHRDGDEEKITSLKGFTYNMVGGKLEKVKLESANMFTEERTKNTRVRKFTLPGVREGAVVEYTYSVTSDFFFHLQPWAFQRDIPTRWSEYRASIPEYFDYKMLMQGYEPLAISQKEDGMTQYMASERVQTTTGGSAWQGGGTSHTSTEAQTINARVTNYHWAMRDVPALREEPYMTTPDDYVARIDFELAGERLGGTYRNVLGDWTKINSSLLESDDFGGVLNRGGFLKELVQQLVAQYADPAARAAAVRELVLRNVKYDGSNRAVGSGSAKHTWEQHRGTAADVNLLLIAALRQADLPAQPVLLSTRTHGRVSVSSPLLEQYNYVVALVPLPDKKELLLDATEPLLPAGVLPQRCLNQVGRLVVPAAEGEGRWVELVPAQRHSHYQQVTMTVDAQGNITSQVQEQHGGYSGVSARSKLTELGEKKYVTELTNQHTNWEVPSYKFAAVADVSQPLSLHYEVRQAATTPGTAQELYLKPLASFCESRNPFDNAQRRFPVDLGAPTQDVVLINLTLPPGYVAELPKSANVSLPEQGGSYVFSASSPTPGTVQLISRLTLAKPVYGAEEYGNLREFYRLALAKQAEAMVIKKQ